MGNMIEAAAFEVVEDATQAFFAPASFDRIDELIGQYRRERQHIDQLAQLVGGDLGNVVRYFIEGNAGDESFHRSLYVNKLFRTERAIKALDTAYWSKALAMTDVLDYMPQKRRDQWNTQLTAWKHGSTKPEEQLPEFTEDSVRSTISSLLAMRAQFFGERVDGIFRSLSKQHVTNCPEGFSKRMILGNVLNEWGHTNYSQAGQINDLRCVIAKFMGRDEPRHNATDSVICAAQRNPGKWMIVDGGALRIRVYVGVGTAHLEVHPQMAYRLNQILSGLYPSAIPSKFRTKPKKAHKEFQMKGQPLPFQVIELLAGMRVASERIEPSWPERYRPIPNTRRFDYGQSEKVAYKEAVKVVESIGGVYDKRGFFQFDYDPSEVLDEIVCSGCIPDQKSHQFYPTPETVALAAVEMAQIGADDVCLEPSAGQGGLADFMPKDRTTCVEISALHCAVLKAKGYTVHQGDFLAWEPGQRRFDRVLMNPPFSEGRWRAHLAAAADLVNSEGRLVAILPASAKGEDVLPGWGLNWSAPFDNEFAGTTVSVVILAAIPPTM